LEGQIAVIIGTFWHIIRVRTFAIIAICSDLENGAYGATILPGLSIDADVILPTVFWMGMLAIDSTG